jgi:hypothetical protein
MSVTQRFVLIGCGSEKQDEKSPARELYTSVYAHKKRDFAETVGDEYAIVSAKHRLLSPSTEVEPYDSSVTAFSKRERAEWSERVVGEIHQRDWEAVDELWVLMGSDYREFLLPKLRSQLDVDVYSPFEATSGNGDQMGWITEVVEEFEEGETEALYGWMRDVDTEQVDISSWG